METFDWKNAQRGEIDWWREHQERSNPSMGEGGLKRYPTYMRVFGHSFSQESILDVGAGAFPLVNWLGNCAKRVSVDPLNADFAAAGFARNRNVEYVCGLAEKLPFADGQFAQVLLLNMLDHLEDWRTAVTEAARVASSSVIIHVHIDGPFAGDGLHKTLLEEELLELIEGRYNGKRVAFCYPEETRPFWLRCLAGVRRTIARKGRGYRIPIEKCWAGIISRG